MCVEIKNIFAYEQPNSFLLFSSDRYQYNFFKYQQFVNVQEMYKASMTRVNNKNKLKIQLYFNLRIKIVNELK